MTTRLWDKGQPLDELVLRFTAGDDPVLDRRLLPYDVTASIAHAQGLVKAGYLSLSDFDLIKGALLDLGASFHRGEWCIAPEEEDCHTALENRLVARLGETGKRLHLGRSRNDQVLVALRLYLRDAVSDLQKLGAAVVQSLGRVTDVQGSIELPGYTHLQRAMPSTVALWAGGFQAEIRDDLEGLQSCNRRLGKCPLGSAAGYGVPLLGLDRAFVSELLGFHEPHEPVTAVQISRGKAEAEILFAISLLLQDCGRLAQDLCLYATSEFGLVKLPERFTTGSSIMPQKRNPDVFELIRGRSAQISSELFAVLVIPSKMSSGYHRDLQLIKAPLFRGLDLAADVLAVLARALEAIEFLPDRCREAMDPSIYATEEAFRLVRDEGLAFRDAYRVIAMRHRGNDARPAESP